MRLALIALCCLRGLAAPQYVLHENYAGADFFSKWDFWSAPDPSGGSVQYADRATAEAAGLAKTTGDGAYLGVDMSSAASNATGRRSVRIQSKAAYNAGLFVVDVKHIPTGCGTWPAFWLYGEDDAHKWPAWGEYDVIEGMHTAGWTMTTLHTRPQCRQRQVVPGEDFTEMWELGPEGQPADNCDINAPGQYHNQGCSQRGPKGSMGSDFNARGGGIFAAEWDPEAKRMRAWFWPRGSEPADVGSGYPEPDSWGRPYSFFSLDPGTCSADHFKNMRLVFNVNLCGELGTPFFAQSCPKEAKTMTCQQFVSDPKHLKEAFWSLSGLKVYLRAGAAGAAPAAPRPAEQPPAPAQPRPAQPGSEVPPFVVMTDGTHPELAPLAAGQPQQQQQQQQQALRPPQLAPGKGAGLAVRGGAGLERSSADQGMPGVTTFGALVLAVGLAGLAMVANIERCRVARGSDRSLEADPSSTVPDGFCGSLAGCCRRLAGLGRCKGDVGITEMFRSGLRSYADRMDDLLEQIGLCIGLVPDESSRADRRDPDDSERMVRRAERGEMGAELPAASGGSWSLLRPRSDSGASTRTRADSAASADSLLSVHECKAPASSERTRWGWASYNL